MAKTLTGQLRDNATGKVTEVIPFEDPRVPFRHNFDSDTHTFEIPAPPERSLVLPCSITFALGALCCLVLFHFSTYPTYKDHHDLERNQIEIRRKHRRTNDAVVFVRKTKRMPNFAVMEMAGKWSGPYPEGQFIGPVAYTNTKTNEDTKLPPDDPRLKW